MLRNVRLSVTVAMVAMTAACTRAVGEQEEGGTAAAPDRVEAQSAVVQAPGAGAVEAPAESARGGEQPASEEGAEGPGAAPGVDPVALVGAPQATDLAAAPVQIPKGWSGTGVLARRVERVPRRAPRWARVAAEVVERDGQRFLVATGRVQKVKDAHLARSTAENRARAEIGRWTRNEKQVGGVIRETWRDPRTGDTFAQIEMPVPGTWVPGSPL